MNGVGLGGQIFIGYRLVLSWFRVVRKFARFCQKPPNLARPNWILMRSRWISKRLGRISMIFWSDTVCVLIFSTDRIENRRDSSQIRSGLLKIGFSASNSPTDSPFSSSGGRDLLLTRHRHRVNQSSGQMEWFLQVGRVSVFF